jgi:hypothetical protein
MKRIQIAPLSALLLATVIGGAPAARAATYPVEDTQQAACYDDAVLIAAPAAGAAFHGQDAQYTGGAASFTVSADGLTVTDNLTGLVWQQSPDTDLDGVLEPADKLSFAAAQAQPAVLNAAAYGGFTDWRLPSIKELYSLIDFRGEDPSGLIGSTEGLAPFIDTTVFGFIYGDESIGERLIDSQYWSSNEYVWTTMNGDHTVFGVNFADGRIKGYGTTLMGQDKTAFVQCVRGNTDYGVNNLVDNGDGTVTDLATGLMWLQEDNGAGLNWQDALAWAEGLSFAGHDDWRLPDVKELQSIVDYTRSPDTHGTAAIDPVFSCSAIVNEGGAADFPYYWASTTHANGTTSPGAAGAYVAFGRGLGWMQAPFPPFNYTLMDVHGAGCQRSDPKDGDPADYPYGNGPQGDVIRIFNHVRCVRDAAATGVGPVPEAHGVIELQAAPNPFNPATSLHFVLPEGGPVRVEIFDAAGRRVARLLDANLDAGPQVVAWNGRTHAGGAAPSGVYLARLRTAAADIVTKITLGK